MKSLKVLRKTLSNDQEIVSVTRKEISLPLTYRKWSGLKAIVSKTVTAQNFFLRKYSGLESIASSSYPRKVRDQYVKEGLPPKIAKLGLQDRQWKLCLDKAFETLSSFRALTEKAVLESLNRSCLSEPERQLVVCILNRPGLLQPVVLGQYTLAEQGIQDSAIHKEFQKINYRRVFSWLRRCYRTKFAKNQKPLIRKKRTYHLDPDMYSFEKKGDRNYICVASLEPRKRIAIPLTNPSLTKDDFCGNIKVVLRHDGKAEIHRSIHCLVNQPTRPFDPPQSKPQPPVHPQLRIVGADKGFKDLLHSTSGKKYGVGYGAKMAQLSDSLQKTNSGRARMHALVKNLKEKLKKLFQNPARSKETKELRKKISRIKKENLGSLKVDHKREFSKKELQKEIGTAVNSFFKEEKPSVLVLESLDFDGGYHFGKRVNRLLKTWHKGLLQDALVKGVKMNRVHLEQVNAAYSSQLCRYCGAVDAKNRKGDQFDCVHCGHKDDANFAASLNIRDRMTDPEIGRYTPFKQVKEILLERHRLRLSNQGLNCAGSQSSANHLNG